MSKKKLAYVDNFATLSIPTIYIVTIIVNIYIEICKKREPKGLHIKALAGEPNGFKGIDSAYE